MKLDYYDFLPWSGFEKDHDVTFVTFTDETQYILRVKEFRSGYSGFLSGFVYERKNKELPEKERYFSVRYFYDNQRTLFATSPTHNFRDYEEFKRNDNKGTPSLW